MPKLLQFYYCTKFQRHSAYTEKRTNEIVRGGGIHHPGHITGIRFDGKQNRRYRKSGLYVAESYGNGEGLIIC